VSFFSASLSSSKDTEHPLVRTGHGVAASSWPKLDHLASGLVNVINIAFYNSLALKLRITT